MNITINLTHINAFLALPADEQIYRFLIYFGWIPIAIIFIYGAFALWKDYIENQWAAKQKFILLAIDIPRGNETSIKAIENLFTYFAGAHGSINLIEKYWEGKFQLGFSFEIVSIDGYTQFLIRTPEGFRNLVETAVYSQYPDAEITEINDYTSVAPSKYPNDEYDVWGAEFICTAKASYPIKTYSEFEDKAASKPEHLFKDPMAVLMDLCATLTPGEQLWYQILVGPIAYEYMDDLGEEVKKILKEKVAAKQGTIGKLFSEIKSWIDELTNQMFSWSMGSFEQAEAKDDSLKMMNLKPREKKRIEAIQKKASLTCFMAKNRMVYLAKKEVKNNPKVVNGFVGYMKLFTDLDLNAFKPDTKVTQTSTSYFFKESRLNERKRKIVKNYKARDMGAGRNPSIMSVEELATIWHFPIESVVKAPLIQKAPGRKAEPPMGLPLGEIAVDDSTIFPEDADDIFSDSNETFGEGAKKEESGGIVKTQHNEIDDIFSIEEDNKENTGRTVKKIITAQPEKKGTPPANLPFV